jgi:ABC-type transport system substrate-binding protein
MWNDTARMELYRKIQRELLELGAGIPLVDQVTIVGARKEVRDYGFNVVTFPVLYDVNIVR